LKLLRPLPPRPTRRPRFPLPRTLGRRHGYCNFVLLGLFGFRGGGLFRGLALAPLLSLLGLVVLRFLLFRLLVVVVVVAVAIAIAVRIAFFVVVVVIVAVAVIVGAADGLAVLFFVVGG